MFIVKRSSRNRKINSFVIKWHRLHGLFKFYFATVKLRINVHIFVIHIFSSYWTTCIAMFLSLFVSSAWCYGERFFFILTLETQKQLFTHLLHNGNSDTFFAFLTDLNWTIVCAWCYEERPFKKRKITTKNEIMPNSIWFMSF